MIYLVYRELHNTGVQSQKYLFIASVRLWSNGITPLFFGQESIEPNV
jgi:hypothetical protein